MIVGLNYLKGHQHKNFAVRCVDIQLCIQLLTVLRWLFNKPEQGRDSLDGGTGRQLGAGVSLLARATGDRRPASGSSKNTPLSGGNIRGREGGRASCLQLYCLDCG
eukprot:SAG22_NODE_5944_length_927_cov_1.397343_2_plen_106_part_00